MPVVLYVQFSNNIMEYSILHGDKHGNTLFKQAKIKNKKNKSIIPVEKAELDSSI